MKEIVGFEGRYSADEMGLIWSHAKQSQKIRGGQWLKGRKSPVGYLYVCLCDKGIYTQYRVHRLIAETFLPNPNKLSDVNHKNGKRDDNRLVNLEWMSRKDNIAHGHLRRKSIAL